MLREESENVTSRMAIPVHSIFKYFIMYPKFLDFKFSLCKFHV